MRPEQLVTQFFQQFSTLIGPVGLSGTGIEALGDDVQQKLRAAAQATFEKLELVSRDEFDAQKAVLARTREKLEALEKQLEELERADKDS